MSMEAFTIIDGDKAAAVNARRAFAAALLDRLHHAVERGLTPAADHHLRALGGEHARRHLADAGARARHDRDLAL